MAVCAGATFLTHGDKTPFLRACCIGIFGEQRLPTHRIAKIPTHHGAHTTSCQVRAVTAGSSAQPSLLRTFQQTRSAPLPCHIECAVLHRSGATTIWTQTASSTHSLVRPTSCGIGALGACPVVASIRDVDAAPSSQKHTVALARNTSVPQTQMGRGVVFTWMLRCCQQRQSRFLKAVLVQGHTLACVLERRGLIQMLNVWCGDVAENCKVWVRTHLRRPHILCIHSDPLLCASFDVGHFFDNVVDR